MPFFFPHLRITPLPLLILLLILFLLLHQNHRPLLSLPTLRLNPLALPISSSRSLPSLRRIPSAAEPSICWIFTCTDRGLPYTQHFSSPGFRHLRLRMPTGLGLTAAVHPAWCRAYYLPRLRRTGQRCVIYADDDVFLDLDALRLAVAARTRGEILVTAGPRHDVPLHINAGFIVFTNLQGRVSQYVSEAWWAMRNQPGNFPYHYLRDQIALNRLIHCDFPGVACFRNAANDRKKSRQLGLLGHCFSLLDKKQKGEKTKCMKRLKTGAARKWDEEGLKMMEREEWGRQNKSLHEDEEKGGAED